MYSTGTKFQETPSSNHLMREYFSEKYKKLRFGLGVGFKIVIRKNIPIDIYFGMDIFGLGILYYDDVPVTRGGISIGYRF